jgi:small multidrug resistance pump
MAAKNTFIFGRVLRTLKASAGFTRVWPAALVVAGYTNAFYLLSLTLRSIPPGVAYAAWSGVGIALIVAGVLVMNLFSRTAGHRALAGTWSSPR